MIQFALLTAELVLFSLAVGVWFTVFCGAHFIVTDAKADSTDGWLLAAFVVVASALTSGAVMLGEVVL